MTDTPAQDGASLPRELNLPILAIRNTVIFPVLAFPINVGREKSLLAVDEALEKDKLLAILAQKEAKNEDPDTGDLYQVGTVVKILKSVKMPGNKLSVIIQGLARIRVKNWDHTDPFLRAEVEVFEEATEHPEELNSKMGSLRELAQRIIDLSPQIPSEASFLVRSIDNPGVLADIVASNLGISVEDKQDLLETFGTSERMDIWITDFRVRKVPNLAKWYSAQNKARFEENTEPLGIENGQKSQQKRASPLGGVSAVENEVTELPSPKKNRAPGGAPKGPGYVVQLSGYHFHNSPMNGTGKQFVQRTLVHNLQERDIALPDATGEMIERPTSEIGISHPLVYEAKKQKVISPFDVDTKNELIQYQFVIQFAWQPQTSSKP